jgi:hypothetical protein
MEISQGNYLCSYLKQTKILLFFYKIGEQEGRKAPVWVSLYQWVGGKR